MRRRVCLHGAALAQQMFWVWTVSLPVTFLLTTEANPAFGTAADIAGIIMFVIGLTIEALAGEGHTFVSVKASSWRQHWG
jgi:steroid 5-alpha reductase family enzyme